MKKSPERIADIELPEGKKVYFVSDLHFGVDGAETSLDRERRFADWLESIRPHAVALFVVGDLLDFWYEYKRAVPRGFTRVIGKLASLADDGIHIHLFTGNHDMWIFDYLPSEIGAPLYRKPIEVEIEGKSFFIGHGDGLGPGDSGYKVLKKIFDNSLCQWLFARIHPNAGIWIASYFSKSSRAHTATKEEKYLGDEREWLMQFCLGEQGKKRRDYYIFGHRHLPVDRPLPKGGRYINLGDWLQYYTYAEFDGEELRLSRLS